MLFKAGSATIVLEDMQINNCVVLATALLLASCRPSDMVCEPGATQSCACVTGATGAQLCERNGSRWGVCVCQAPPPSPEDAKPEIPAAQLPPPPLAPGPRTVDPTTLRVDVGTPQIRGSLQAAGVRKVALEHLAPVRDCYADALSHDPTLAGRIFVKFIVSMDGWVQIAAVANATLEDAILQQCVVEALQKWTFPKPKSGIGVVTLPFDLQPPGPPSGGPNGGGQPTSNAAVTPPN